LLCASSGAGQPSAPRVRLFGLGDVVIPASNEALVDLGPFAPPDENARMVLLDVNGVIGRGTLHAIATRADCELCGASSGSAQLRLDAAPARRPFHDFDHHVAPVVVGPLADGAPDPALVIGEIHGGVVWSVDLDGDGRGDVARTYAPRACPGPSRHLSMGASACDLMQQDVCESQASRGPRAWRAFERVQHARCQMDGQRDLRF
jgi:hypothetical protein